MSRSGGVLRGSALTPVVRYGWCKIDNHCRPGKFPRFGLKTLMVAWTAAACTQILSVCTFIIVSSGFGQIDCSCHLSTVSLDIRRVFLFIVVIVCCLATTVFHDSERGLPLLQGTKS